MSTPALPPTLPDRWAAAAADDASTDQALLQLVESCRTGASINEAALLKRIVQHANEIGAHAAAQASPKTAMPSADQANT